MPSGLCYAMSHHPVPTSYERRPSGMTLPLLVLLLAALADAAQAIRAHPVRVHPPRVHQALRDGWEPHEGHNISNAVTVVVNFNLHNTVNLETVRLLHSSYSAAFYRVVFTGQERPVGLDKAVLWSSCEYEWTFFSLCLAYTMAEYPEARQGGYLFLGDDAIMNPCQMATLNLSKFWTPPLYIVPNKREDRDTSAWLWWTRKGTLRDMRDGIKANGSEALEAALEELPSFYKARGREAHGEDFIDRAGHFRLLVFPATQDFLYVPAIHTADWIHLAHHFARYGVMAEMAMPQIIYLLGGTEGVEHPPTYNIIGHDPRQTVPPNATTFTDQDAEQLLRRGSGIYLPSSWIQPEAPPALNATGMTFMHSYKMSRAYRRQLFADWWRSLPCLD